MTFNSPKEDNLNVVGNFIKCLILNSYLFYAYTRIQNVDEDKSSNTRLLFCFVVSALTAYTYLTIFDLFR